MKNNDIREFARKMEGKKLTILGHENIDVDAFLSGVLLSRLFDFLKIDNEFIVLEEVAEGNETYDIVKKLFKKEKPVHDLSMMFIIFFLR